MIKQYREISSVIQFLPSSWKRTNAFYNHCKHLVTHHKIYNKHRLWYFLETQMLLFSQPLQILQAKNTCSFDTALAYVTNFLFWAESLQKPADWLKIKRNAEYHSNWLAALLTCRKDFLLEQELQVKTPGQNQIWHNINNTTETQKLLDPSPVSSL